MAAGDEDFVLQEEGMSMSKAAEVGALPFLSMERPEEEILFESDDEYDPVKEGISGPTGRRR